MSVSSRNSPPQSPSDPLAKIMLTENGMQLLESDLVETMFACINGRLTRAYKSIGLYRHLPKPSPTQVKQSHCQKILFHTPPLFDYSI